MNAHRGTCPGRKPKLSLPWLESVRAGGLWVPNGRLPCAGQRDAYKNVEPNTVRDGFEGQQTGSALRAYQARTAAPGLRDTTY